MDQTEANDIVSRCEKDLLFHIENIQGVKTLEPYQKKIIKAALLHERIAIYACHSLGKTFTMSRIVLAFTNIFKGCKVITTAPTFNQVKRLLWSEIRTGWARSKSPLGGEMLQTEWKLDDDWFALGFTSRNEAAGVADGQGEASSFQGFHAPRVLIVFDEATGIPPVIWKQAEGLMTSGICTFIAIGNPTSPTAEFAKIVKSRSWHKIHLSCFDSPNFAANNLRDLTCLQQELDYLRTLDDERLSKRLRSYKIVQPDLLKVSWAMEMAMEWGVDHPLFQSKVLGKFPQEGSNVLIPLSSVELAQARHENYSETPHKEPELRSIGVDPARFGTDKTILTVLDGTHQTHKQVFTKYDTSEITGELVNLISNLPRRNREVIIVDGGGLGAGVIDQLKARKRERHLPPHIEIREIQFGASCKNEKDKKHFANLKAKMFKTLATDLRTELSLMPESIYQGQLPTILFKFTPKGQMIIESKDDYKKRTGLSSPDEADSLALANLGRYEQESQLDPGFYTPEMTQEESHSIINSEHELEW